MSGLQKYRRKCPQKIAHLPKQFSTVSLKTPHLIHKNMLGPARNQLHIQKAKQLPLFCNFLAYANSPVLQKKPIAAADERRLNQIPQPTEHGQAEVKKHPHQ